MRLSPPPSFALTQLINFFCNLISCEHQYPSPVSLLPPFASREIDESRNNFIVVNGTFPLLPENDTLITTYKRREREFSRALIGNELEDEEMLVEPFVQIPDLGGVEGYHMTVISGRKIYAFEGIPYSLPPIGSLRFQAPQIHPAWNETLQAKDPGPRCIQLDRGRVKGSENCLRLNIYTPKIPYQDSHPKLPVLFFIHGGSFLFGSGASHGPAYLLKEDVIFVSINYRLGILGAFSSGDEVASGNWQLKDQALAINWVHQHISSFGGDPSKISLVGQSAGAVSAHLQMMSPFAKDKLNAVISISGSAYNFWGLNTLERGARLSRANSRLARCPIGRGSRAMLECMQEVPAEWLVANQLFSVGWGFPVPMIEPQVPGAFLTESPDSAYLNGNVARIPWIATVTSEESNTVIAEVAARGGVPWLNRIFDADASLLLGFRGRVPAYKESQIVTKIRNFYGAGPPPSLIPRQFFTQVANARFFTVPFHKSVQMHSQIAPTYAGIFNYTNYVGTPGRLGLDPKEYGVTHTDDLVFLLNSTGHPPIATTEEAFAITKLVVNVYSNFAGNRLPTFTAEDENQYKFWEVVKDPKEFQVLQIDKEVKMIENPYQGISDFWESLELSDMTSYVKLKKLMTKIDLS